MMKEYCRLSCEAGPSPLITVLAFSLCRLMVDPRKQLPHSLAHISLSLNTYNCVFENSKWKLSTTLWKGCKQKSQKWEIRRAKNLVKLHWHFSEWEQNCFLSFWQSSCHVHDRGDCFLAGEKAQWAQWDHIYLSYFFSHSTQGLSLKALELPGL